MPRYLNPQNDFIFKRVFGEHKNLCISLLNSLLPLDVPIETIEYLPIELGPDVLDLKNSSVDVRCTDQNKRQFLVEMQMQWSETFKNRVLFNASKVYVRQLKKKNAFELLHPVYSLNLIGMEFDKTTDEFYHHYKIVNLANSAQQIEGLEFIFVELPKFQPKNVAEKRLMVLWLRYLTEMEDREKAPPELLEDENLTEAVRCLEESSYSMLEIEIYERFQDRELRERAIKHDSLLEGRAEGLAEGRAEGLAEGRAEGLAEGLAEGRAEGLQEGEAERKKLAAALEAREAALAAKEAALEAQARRIAELEKLEAKNQATQNT